MSRLPNQPGERIDRQRTLSFTFDGKRVQAYEGDTIGSALYAAGQRTFSRSFKYHRRRGLMCCSGQCPNCIVAVDGAPGARACIEPVREGIKVQHLNAASLEFDPMRATDVFGGPFTPPGFYYKTFIRPRRWWPVYEKLLRNAAGLGKLIHEQPEREWRTEYRRRHVDVLVVGGGIAGLAAAVAAAELGADMVLADEGPELGGQQLIEPASERIARTRGAGARRGRRDPRARIGAGLLRRPGPRLAGGHPAPGAGRAARLRDRHDRAAAGVRRQRPTGRDARRRRPAAGVAVRGQPGPAGGDRHHLGPRPARRPPRCATPAWRSSRWPTCAPQAKPGGERAAARRRAGVRRLHGGRGQGPQGGAAGGDRPRRGRRRPQLRVRPAGGLRRRDPGHLAAAAGRRPQRL